MTPINEILLRRKHKINIERCAPYSGPVREQRAELAAIMKNVERIGFKFDRELTEILMTFPTGRLEEFYFDLMPKLRPLVSADIELNPMYPNFPAQVADASDAELYFNALVHYWSYGTLLPGYKKNERMPLFEETNTTTLTVGTDKDVLEIFTNLLSSKTSISQQDTSDLEQIVKDYPNFYDALPDEIPLKEDVALIGSLILNVAPIKDASAIQKYYKTATDVLRLIARLQDTDISLANAKFSRSLKRRERRMVMDLLSGCGNILEDMYRHKWEWIRVGEIVHPFEFKEEKYAEVNRAFNTLRNEHKPLFTPGKVQNAINAKSMRIAAKLLTTRPGDFARQLDKLLRDCDDGDKNYIVNAFSSVADKVSVPVLLQVRQHFIGRANRKVRVIIPKGKVAKASSIPMPENEVRADICRDITRICNNALIDKFRDKPPMGKVYIDNAMEKFIVPFSQRSASSGTKTLVRGSRVGLRDNATTARAFIWWTNTDNDSHGYDGGRVDIDLSATIYDEKWNYLERVSYTQLRSARYGAYHSCDIVNGGQVDGKGAAEFIDIDLDTVAKAGRYIVFQVYSFTGQRFSRLENCRFGWMERQNVNSGEIFEPSTVDMSIRLTADSTVAVPVIFDCTAREFIWCDLNTEAPHGVNNLESNLKGVTAACYAMANMDKTNLFDLIYLNARARGSIVINRDDADIIFSNDTTPPTHTTYELNEGTGEFEEVTRSRTDYQIVTAYDTDYFMGQMM